MSNTKTQTRRDFLRASAAAGLALPILAPAAMASGAAPPPALPEPPPGYNDPPAVLKLLVLLLAAGEEADALIDAHGVQCDCGSCWDANGASWAIKMAASAIESEIVDFHADKQDAAVADLRRYLTAKLGDSADPGNTRRPFGRHGHPNFPTT